jgi:hypothetical protein
LYRERRGHQGQALTGRFAGLDPPRLSPGYEYLRARDGNIRGLALEIPHKEPLDTCNKQRVFVAFERPGREEKTLKAVVEMPKPPSPNMGLAHLPDRMIERD